MSRFELIEQHALSHLNATASLFRHADSGAEHLHLSTQEPELAFLVGFPTVPMTGDGRAHILEHIVLCGSRRFPVRDPFFMMMRRSVATFMNAMTYADRTVYPFSTTDPADFQNLLEVYLDATFFPNLEQSSFLQEGWRIELDGEGGTPVYQGVVLNEMKGMFVNPTETARGGLMAELFAGTTYAHSSGGDPLQIPSLDPDALREFHRTHYHPSQALFMTAGPVDPFAVQHTIEQLVLSRLPVEPGARRLPQLAADWVAPRRLKVTVPSQGDETTGHGLQLVWRLHDSADVDRTLRLQLLVSLLIGHGGAPLRQAIEKAGFGYAARLFGVDDGPRQVVLHLGMAGLREEQLDAARHVLLDALTEVAEHGLPPETVRAGLRDLQFGHRQEVNGLNRLIDAAQGLLRNQPVASVFGDAEALARLEPAALQPDFVQQAMREILACQAHAVVHLAPSADYFAGRERTEQAALAQRVAVLDEPARQHIRNENAALAAEQIQADAIDCLPRLRRGDLVREPRALPVLADGPAVAHEMAANGLSHVQLCVDLSRVPQADWPWLHLYANLLAGLGADGEGWADALRRRHERVPAFSINLGAPPTLGGSQWLTLTIACSTLREQRDTALSVIDAWLFRPDLDDTQRVAQLLRSGIQARTTSLVFSAAQFAQLSLVASLTPTGAFRQQVEGLPSLAFMAQLNQLLELGDGPAQICEHLKRMQACVLAGTRQFLCGGQDSEAEVLLQRAEAMLGPFQPVAEPLPLAGPVDAPAQIAVHAGTGINACMMAWPVPAMSHPDAPVLAVVAELVVQRHLHTRIREQGGAYGASAGYTPMPGLFVIKSDSDPRLALTFRDFEASLSELAQATVSDDALEQAVISAVKNLDPPATPSADMFHRWGLLRSGVGDAVRAAYRQGILDCTPEQVQRAVATWLPLHGAARVAVAGHLAQDLAGLSVVDLAAIARELGEQADARADAVAH